MFMELKQQTGAFYYRFWSKYMPKLNYYRKKEEPTPLEQVETETARKRILEVVRATEMHIALSCIAMGLLQSLFIFSIGKVKSSQLRYQRTPSRERVSEGALMLFLETFFPTYVTNARIAYNANNSGTAGRVRNILGFTGLLMIQTFYSQVL